MSNYAYDVFISYRHTEHDRAWAKWLLEALETYRVPKGLQQRGFPARIGKVFRDEDELPTSADLSTNIQQALEGSKFLVVICSKDTPSSLWVDKEVATFRRLGKGDHIIPLLVEGTPETSFPPSLMTLKKPVKQTDGTVTESDEPLEPIAADVRQRKDEKESTLKRLSLLRILSAILGCAFDDLRQRDHQRGLRKKRIIYSVAAICSLFIAGGSLYLWDYNRVKVEYYNTIVYRWGVPEGVGRLSEERIAHKNNHFRFEYRKRRVERVSAENSAGRKENIEAYESVQEVRYREDGLLERVVFKDVRGRIRYLKKYEFYGEKFDKPDSAVVDLLTEYLTPYTFSSVRYTTTDYNTYRSEVTRNLVVFDRNGYPERVRYRNYYGLVRADIDGVIEIVYGRTNGRMADRESYMYSDTAKSRSAETVGYKEVMYNGRGDAVESRRFTMGGLPTVDEYGIHLRRYRYDTWGNQIEVSYFDSRGKPTSDQFGVARQVSEFDERGYELVNDQYDTNGKLTAGKLGYAGIRSVYDTRGNEIEKTYIDADGKPANNKYGFGKVVADYDKEDKLLAQRFFEWDGKPAKTYGGVHGIDIGYDSSGNRIWEKFMDKDGKPAVGEWGYAFCRRWYDSRRNRIREERYGLNGEPVALNGVFRYENEFDEKGNCIRSSRFGVKGEPVMNVERYKYDEWGNQVEIAYQTPDGLPVNDKDGYARLVREYEYGSLKKIRYFDVSGCEVRPKKQYKRNSKVIIY